jgi:NAD(P)-dependent dehydrogenase (short-subunit alcohol dehydrogenase family)
MSEQAVLEGKVVLVTGAGRGLGHAYAVDAAARGARVVVNDVDAEGAQATVAAIESAGGIAVARAGSIADWDTAGELVDTAVETFGGLDGLVNNAGVMPVGVPWEETGERLRAVVEVNLLGTLFCGTRAMDRMKDHGGGAIVNVTSGTHLGFRDLTAYGATKGGVASLTYGWAIHGADVGVRVNAISPLARTPMMDEFLDVPTGAEPADVAPLVSYLLSDRAAAVNGQVVRLDGSSLSLLRRPSYPGPHVDGERFSLEEIAAAFDRGELGRLAPVESFG